MSDAMTTTVDCPAWCTEPAGHPMEAETGGWPIRHHFREGAELQTLGYGGLPRDVAVCLSAIEIAASDIGPVLDMTDLVIEISGYEEGDPMTGPQARQLAAELLNAADEWDTIEGGH
jgi:hypothetical protein